MECVDGINSADYFRQPGLENTVRNHVAIKMLELMNNLFEQKIIHGDLKSTNFIIDDDQPVLIDLDSMKQSPGKLRFEKGMLADKTRFRENWVKEPEIKAMFDLLMDAKVNG